MGWQSHRTWGEARLLAGLSRTTNQARASILPSGEAALGLRFGGEQVNVGYSRAVTQAYGRGQFLASDLLSLGVARDSPLGALSVGARRVISDLADIDNRDLVTSEAFFTLRRDLAAGASIDTGYLYRERTGAVALSGGGLQVSINYSSAFQ
jgi:hypothetical protein